MTKKEQRDMEVRLWDQWFESPYTDIQTHSMDGDKSEIIDIYFSPIEKIFHIYAMKAISERLPYLSHCFVSHFECQEPIYRKDGKLLYIMDFVFRLTNLNRDKVKHVWVNVELDGHDFHEKTKEQAKKDKSRDRAVVGLGYIVLRYTGSEVWNDPEACVLSALKTGFSLTWDSKG